MAQYPPVQNSSSSPTPQVYPAQSPGATSRSGNFPFLLGLIFGLLYSGALVIWAFLMPLLALAPTFLLLSLMIWFPPLLVQWIFYLLTGTLAAWRTGKISTGTITSFWINLWYLAGIIVVFFLPRSHALRTYGMSSQGYTTGFLLFALISFVISVGLGAGFGTLGGLIGKALKKPKMGTSIPSQQGLH